MASVPVSLGEHESLMTEVQIRSPSTATATTMTTTKHKKPTNWLKAYLCQNKMTFGLCLSLLLAITIVMSLLFLYALHTRLRPERKMIFLKLQHLINRFLIDIF